MSGKKIERAEIILINRHGVLDRVTGRIRQEGWNIKHLAVDECEDGTAKMEIDIEGASGNLAKGINNILKLSCVVSITIMENGEKQVLIRPPTVREGSTVKDAPVKIPPKKEGVFRVMAVNPGSTSTKIGIYDDATCIFNKAARHDTELLSECASILDQKALRVEGITKILEEAGFQLSSLDAISGRGGMIKPIESGVYPINEKMLEDCRSETAAVHASVLGAIIAAEMAAPLGIPSYIVDPIVVYEMDPVTRLSGMPGIERINAFHALNQKATARRFAQEIGKSYENTRLVVAHMGGGITVGAHRYGRVVDVNEGISEGPFTPERSGTVPLAALVDMCFSGDFTRAEMKEKINGKGGMKAYLGTSDIVEVFKMINDGDEFAALVMDSMTYQVSKEIGAMVAALEGVVDAIILTGGLAKFARFTGPIKQRVYKLAPVYVYPGEDELFALASGALRVLRGTERPSEYE